jgi:hypothetical protein
MFKISITSLFCSNVESPGSEGQSIFTTVATQTARNSCLGGFGCDAPVLNSKKEKSKMTVFTQLKLNECRISLIDYAV